MEDDAIEPPGVVEGMTRDEREEEFIRLLSQGCTVRQAASAVKISFTTFYRKRKAEPAFAKAWDDAERICVAAIESALYKRALSRSDRAAELLLRGLAPEKYRERSEVRHEGGVVIKVITGMPKPSDDDDEDPIDPSVEDLL